MFKKGQSGNPGGRPKQQFDITSLAREYSREALMTLAKVAKDENSPPAARVSAAVAILDRGHGKPAQTINANVRRSIIDISDAELAAIAAGSGEGATQSEDGAGVVSGLH